MQSDLKKTSANPTPRSDLFPKDDKGNQYVILITKKKINNLIISLN